MQGITKLYRVGNPFVVHIVAIDRRVQVGDVGRWIDVVRSSRGFLDVLSTKLLKKSSRLDFLWQLLKVIIDPHEEDVYHFLQQHSIFRCTEDLLAVIMLLRRNPVIHIIIVREAERWPVAVFIELCSLIYTACYRLTAAATATSTRLVNDE